MGQNAAQAAGSGSLLNEAQHRPVKADIDRSMARLGPSVTNTHRRWLVPALCVKAGGAPPVPGLGAP